MPSIYIVEVNVSTSSKLWSNGLMNLVFALNKAGSIYYSKLYNTGLDFRIRSPGGVNNKKWCEEAVGQFARFGFDAKAVRIDDRELDEVKVPFAQDVGSELLEEFFTWKSFMYLGGFLICLKDVTLKQKLSKFGVGYKFDYILLSLASGICQFHQHDWQDKPYLILKTRLTFFK